MSKFPNLMDTWDTIKEVDLRPLRQQALKTTTIAIVGAPGSGRADLAEQMRHDPARPAQETDTPVIILGLEEGERVAPADLVILMMDSRKTDSLPEQALVKSWHNSGIKVLVFINPREQPEETTAISQWTSRPKRRVVWGSPLDTQFLVEQFAPVVIESLPDKLLSLGRHFPLFRVPIAHYLINDTCLSNAAYALSTGLAETVAVFDIPIAVTDTVILTKTQAFLAYKLGLALGYSTRWQDYVVEFGGVLGSGFALRQIARTLVGFIPIWGLVPKTAIAYAGTYVVGQTILGWYLAGRHISRKQIRQLYTQAFGRGKEVAQRLLIGLPRPRFPKLSRPRLPKLSRSRLPRRKPGALPAPQSTRVCPGCNQSSAADASYCQYCGTLFPRG